MLEYWPKDCQELLQRAPKDAYERLGNALNMLGEILEEDLRSITRQIYPSIIA